MLSRLTFVLASLATCCAMAQSATCVTTSHGKLFRAQDSLDAFAQQKAVADCQRDASTSNTECSANVLCDHGNVQPTVCQATSNGLVFRANDTLPAFARLSAIADCQRNASTRNADCETQVVCAGQLSRPAMCQTASAGKIFSGKDLSVDLAKMATVSACQKDASTRNDECDRNTVCDDGRQPVGTCQTTSAGKVFRGASLPLPFARQRAIADCQRDASTRNAECESNTICAADVVTTPVPTPVPSGAVCFVRETRQSIPADRFFTTASTMARASNNCLVAKITTQGGRIYRADGGRLTKGADMTDAEIASTLSAAGLSSCSKLTCDLQ